MKINIIYESYFDNGKKIAEDLLKILESKNADVELFSVKDRAPENIRQADLYIFSAPTRKFALPPGMGNFLDAFTVSSKNAKYALMTTYLDPRTIALKKMTEKLDKKGIKKAVEDLKIRVRGLKGPLIKDYVDRLRPFAEALLK